jgi:GNAT superfamily N-acetyltransferase
MTPVPFQVVHHERASAFLARAETWLMEAEAENNLILGVALEYAEAEAEPPDPAEAPWFATVEDANHRVVGCAFRTPPHKVGLTRLTGEAAPALAWAIARRFDHVPGFLGPEDVALDVAKVWAALRGGDFSPGMRQRIYRLDAVTPPASVRGRIRRAETADLALALAWGEGFARDAGSHLGPSASAVASWIQAGLLFLWETDGEPVSMTVARGATAHGIRVGYVYTPPEHRRSGYASALVATVSQWMLDGGYRFCVLYTDLGNPTSNAIYARVGYRPVCDVMDVEIR